MIESMTIQVLQVILLTATRAGRLGTADAFSAVEGWLTAFAMVALIISLILVFYLSVSHERTLGDFRHEIIVLSAHTKELEKRIVELEQQTLAKVFSELVSPEESEELAAAQKS